MPAHPDSTRTRNARRRAKDRTQRATLDREQRRDLTAALADEVPTVGLTPRQHYAREVAKRRAQGKPVLRSLDEYQRANGGGE